MEALKTPLPVIPANAGTPDRAGAGMTDLQKLEEWNIKTTGINPAKLLESSPIRQTACKRESSIK